MRDKILLKYTMDSLLTQDKTLLKYLQQWLTFNARQNLTKMPT